MISVVWQCINFYMELYGRIENGIFHDLVWLMVKIYENCPERGI